MTFLTIERDGGIWTVTMNQPETRNALTGNTAVEEFVQLCDAVRTDASVKSLILTGAGPIFSSGGNVKDMQRFFEDALTPDLIREEYRNGIQRIPNALYQLDVHKCFVPVSKGRGVSSQSKRLRRCISGFSRWCCT